VEPFLYQTKTYKRKERKRKEIIKQTNKQRKKEKIEKIESVSSYHIVQFYTIRCLQKFYAYKTIQIINAILCG
jgi:hypothetical protein